MAKIPTRDRLEARVGELVKSRYELTSLVGVGGQGAVYAARDVRDGDVVAVKVLHERADREAAARERLSREAQALVALAGTAAVQVFDQGFTTDGRFCLVTEFLEGEDLSMTLDRMADQAVAFRKIDIPFLFEPIVSVLEKAHAVDIIHRDLKPENVFLQRIDGTTRVRLMDFGFAKFVRMKGLTQEGFVAGSPAYIAPEVWMEEPITASADVYAMGAMIFRVLAGAPPFVGEKSVDIYKLATRAPRPSLHARRVDLPKEVDQWVAMALAIDPRERFQTPLASYRALRAVLGLRK